MTENLLENNDIETGAIRPDGLPDKFWDDKQKAIRLSSLVQSYLELEKKLSTMIPQPDSDEGRFEVLRKMGLPESPDKYDITINHAMFEPDEDVNQRLFEKGFTAEQAQMVYDLAAERLMPMIVELATEFEADREVEKLISEFGGEEKWQEVSRQLLAFANKNLPENVVKNLAGSYDGVMVLYKMMKGPQGEGKIMQGEGQNAMSGDEQELHQMMRDPRYWQQRDPAFIQKVTEGFKQLYA